MSTYFRYQHLRTNNPGSEPSSEVIREGEIAVNLAKDNEKLFLKNTDDEIVKFIPEAQIDAKIAAQTGSTESEINELTNSVNAISGAVGALDTKVNGVSSTTSTALESKVDSSTYNSYTSATDSALSSKANSTDVYNKSETYTKAEVDTKVLNDINDFFDDVRYEESGTTHVISFYHGNTLKGVVDAAPFLVDGMVQDVEVKTIDGVTYLVISFNTDAGRQNISVPITSIFNPGNYFTKDEVEDLIGDEKIRAEGAESVLTTNLANEITARTKAVFDEETRAKRAEAAISGSVDDNRSNLNELSGKSITEIVSSNNSIESSTAATRNGTVKADIQTNASKISGLTAVVDSDEGAAKITGVAETDSVKKGIENLYKSIESEVAARKAAMLARTITSANKGITITETPNADGYDTTVALTLDGETKGIGKETTGVDNALSITNKGLFLSTDWTCGDYDE